MVGTQPDVADLTALASRIRCEYLEMPGLRLTEDQARRLWTLDTPTCTTLLSALVAARFLRRMHDGSYVRI